MDKSIGHVCFADGREFFRGPEGDLYQADLRCSTIRTTGYRGPATWECSARKDGHRWHLRHAWGVILDESGQPAGVVHP